MEKIGLSADRVLGVEANKYLAGLRDAAAQGADVAAFLQPVDRGGGRFEQLQPSAPSIERPESAVALGGVGQQATGHSI
jgi:hypothetical protein